MTTASRSLATAPWRARFASGSLQQSYTTNGDTTEMPNKQDYINFVRTHVRDPVQIDQILTRAEKNRLHVPILQAFVSKDP